MRYYTITAHGRSRVIGPFLNRWKPMPSFDPRTRKRPLMLAYRDEHRVARCDPARKAGLAILSWSLDPKDWASDDATTITERVVEKAKDGDVILLHDMSDSSVTAALRIIDRLKAKGFRFVTVSELAKIKGVTLEPGRVYTNFP